MTKNEWMKYVGAALAGGVLLSGIAVDYMARRQEVEKKASIALLTKDRTVDVTQITPVATESDITQCIKELPVPTGYTCTAESCPDPVCPKDGNVIMMGTITVTRALTDTEIASIADKSKLSRSVISGLDWRKRVFCGGCNELSVPAETNTTLRGDVIETNGKKEGVK